MRNQNWIFNALLMTSFLSVGCYSLSASSGLRAVLIYTIDDSIVGADIKTQEVSAAVFNKFSGMKKIMSQPVPLASSYELLNFLYDRCDVQLKCGVRPNEQDCSKCEVPRECDEIVTTNTPKTTLSITKSDKVTTPTTFPETKTPKSTVSVTKSDKITTPSTVVTKTPTSSIPVTKETTETPKLTTETFLTKTPSKKTSEFVTPSQSTVSITKTPSTTVPVTKTDKITTPSTETRTFTTPTKKTKRTRTTKPVTVTQPTEKITKTVTQTPSTTEIVTKTPSTVVTRISSESTTSRPLSSVTQSKTPSRETTKTPFKGPTYLPQPTKSRPSIPPWTGTYRPFTGTFRQGWTWESFTGGNTWKTRSFTTRETTTTPKYDREYYDNVFGKMFGKNL